MKKEPVDFKDIAVQNEKLVITLLRRHGVLSQTQLRKYSGLSMSTSSSIIARLRGKGYIIETKGVSSKRGAKPVNLSINPGGCYAVGVELRTDSVYAGLFDFNANLEGDILKSVSDKSPEAVAAAVKETVGMLMADYPYAASRTQGIGVAISGSIRDNSFVVLSSPLGWKNVDFKQLLSGMLDIPVVIYPTQVRMFAEMDIESPHRNMVYVNIGNGVGSHVILDGHLCGGATGRIGEIGHVVMIPQGKLCGCGNRGCLETLISGRAIARRIREDIGKGLCQPRGFDIENCDLPETVIARWSEMIAAGDSYGVALAREVALYLSRAVSVMVNICDPQIITLAGYVAQACFEHLKEAILETFETDVYNYSERSIKITKARSGNLALIKGAAISILQ
jgi:N-acetylglucosamine repressor